MDSSETQMCRLARAFAVRMKPNLPFEPAHSQGVPVPLFRWEKRGTKIQYCLCSPFSLKILPLFPFILEINSPIFPCSPKPLGEPQILVPIIRIGTLTIQACMIFFIFDSILVILLSIHFSAEVSSEDIFGVT